MLSVALAIVIAISVWWASTGVVMLVARRGAGRPLGVMIAASVLALASFAGLYAGARMQTPAGAYLGFFSAIGLWAWHELSFLLGTLTGPRRTPCPGGLSGTARFRAAFQTIRDHELAILASVILVTTITLGGQNLTGLFVFLALWTMRISAKLNIYFGAPHAVSALIPPHLAYMTSYFRTDRISPLLPIALALSVCAFVYVCVTAAGSGDAHITVGATLIATFLALAIIEHLFLMLPVEDAALWSWALPAGAATSPAARPIETGTNEKAALNRAAS